MMKSFHSWLIALSLIAATAAAAQSAPAPSWTVLKNRQKQEDVRSNAKFTADEMSTAGKYIEAERSSAPAFGAGSNVQVNSPAQDSVQQFDGFRPFVHAVQSNTSVARSGNTIVAAYNNSAGVRVTQVSPGILAYQQFLLSGFSTSRDGGRTWTSGFVPPAAGAHDTYGDPVVGVDSVGTFYFATLGADGNGVTTVQVNRSTDGLNWTPATVIDTDQGDDKPWMSIGPNADGTGDAIYVTWTRFTTAGAQLWLAKSTDGGQKWTKRAIFAPGRNANPLEGQSTVQYSNPTVDPDSGALYIPFLHLTNADADLIRMLISNDGGVSFHWARFNIPGAPDDRSIPVVQPGTFVDCGTGGFRNVIHSGNDLGGGRFGLPRFMHASRVVVQPSARALAGKVYMAWNASTSPFFGETESGSNIWFIRSDNGGASWTVPIVVNPQSDHRHIHPALALDKAGSVDIAYYTQHADGSLDVEMAHSSDNGDSFPVAQMARITTSPMRLPPASVPIPTVSDPYRTQNFDRNVQPCYAIGEYMSLDSGVSGEVDALWSDTRRMLTEPGDPFAALSGIHPQPDVDFQAIPIK